MVSQLLSDILLSRMMSLVSCPIEPLIDPHSNGPRRGCCPKPQGPAGIAELGHYMYVGELREEVGGLQFAYTCDQMVAFLAAYGNWIHSIGAWDQPRDQRMFAYRLQL